MKHVLRVWAAEDDQALEQFVSERLELSVSDAVQHVARGGVYVDGRRQRAPSVRLSAGQKVTVHDLPRAGEEPEPEVRSVFADDDLVVLDKPAGMPSIATRRGGELTLEDLARERFGASVRLLHRLDRGASGLILLTRTARARRDLDRQLRARALVRRYLALVAGRPEQRRWVIDRPLAKRAGLAVVASTGKPAVTHVELLAQSGTLALLSVRLETGRLHQIRAHLACDGLPLLGDGRYGGPPAPRLALHAHCLAFTHPRGEALKLHSPLPPELLALDGALAGAAVSAEAAALK